MSLLQQKVKCVQRNSFHPSEALAREDKPFKGIKGIWMNPSHEWDPINILLSHNREFVDMANVSSFQFHLSGQMYTIITFF